MNLYDIDSTLNEILTNGYSEDCIDTETGEFQEDKFNDLLGKLNLDRDTKIENIAIFVKSLLCDIENIKKEEEVLKSRRVSKEKKANYLLGLVSGSLLRNEQKKFETARVKLSFRKSEAVKILDKNLIPDNYITTKTEVKESIDLVEIKKALKADKKVAGAELEIRQNLQLK